MNAVFRSIRSHMGTTPANRMGGVTIYILQALISASGLACLWPSHTKPVRTTFCRTGVERGETY